MYVRLSVLTFAAGMLGTPPEGAFFSQDGAAIPYVPLIQGVGVGVGNAPTNDHQRAVALFTNRTSDDGHSQENTVGIETAVATGYNRSWEPFTAFANGSNVYVLRDKTTANGAYRQISGEECRSGGQRPSSFGDREQKQLDGSCVWLWINLPNVSGKVGLYSEETISPGAGNTWNLALNTLLEPNTRLSFHANAELDFGNNAAECFGLSNCENLEVKTGGTFRSTHAVLIDTENRDSVFTTHFGLRLAGSKLASDADIETDASGGVGLGICSTKFTDCTHSVAAIQDRSRGTIGIDLEGSYAEAAITSHGFRVAPDGAIASKGAIAGRMFKEEMFTPVSSRSSCEAGTFADDTNYHYVCVHQNKWRRTALEDF